MLNLDDGLLTKAESIAEQQGRTLKDLLVEYLHHMVMADKKRLYRLELLRPYVDGPTPSLWEMPFPKPGAVEKKPRR